MKKIIHREYYVCDYCGKEHQDYHSMFAYDEDLKNSRVIDICSKECLETHKQIVKERWDSDSEFRDWYGTGYTLEQYYEKTIRYNGR